MPMRRKNGLCEAPLGSRKGQKHPQKIPESLSMRASCRQTYWPTSYSVKGVAAASLAAPRHFRRGGLGDHHGPRRLRVVLQERPLDLQLLRRRLHHPVDVGHARGDRVLARRRAVPRIVEELPGVLVARRCRIELRRPPGPSSTFTSTERIGVPSCKTTPKTLWPFAARVTRAMNDFSRIRVIAVSFHFILPLTISPFRVRYQRALVLPEILVLLDVDLARYLTWGAVPARDEQAKRPALKRGERLAVQVVGEQRLVRQRLARAAGCGRTAGRRCRSPPGTSLPLRHGRAPKKTNSRAWAFTPA